MTQKNKYPVKMLPYLKETVWGGSKLEKYYGKERHDLSNIAESWELSAIKGMESYSYDKKSFDEIFKEFNSFADCPVLIKFIDSESDLSIQVHPSEKDGNALPKNECWYILSADKDSKIAYGFKSSVAKSDIDESISNGTVCNALNYVNVKPGDFFYVPAGLVHAIGKGITLLEIQQSSDTTYRIFDYNRTDKNGRPRELHIEKAKSAIKHFSSKEINDLCFSRPDDQDGILCACEYFSVFKITSEKNLSKAISNKNSSLTFLTDGSFTLDGRSFEGYAGDTFYIPPGDGKTDLIISAEEAVLTVF